METRVGCAGGGIGVACSRGLAVLFVRLSRLVDSWTHDACTKCESASNGDPCASPKPHSPQFKPMMNWLATWRPPSRSMCAQSAPQVQSVTTLQADHPSGVSADFAARDGRLTAPGRRPAPPLRVARSRLRSADRILARHSRSALRGPTAQQSHGSEAGPTEQQPPRVAASAAKLAAVIILRCRRPTRTDQGDYAASRNIGGESAVKIEHIAARFPGVVDRLTANLNRAALREGARIN
jgi:hypothetical protein